MPAAMAGTAWTSDLDVLDVPVTLGAGVRRVRSEKLNHTGGVEPRRDALIANEVDIVGGRPASAWEG
jgi:hypothetical protein